MYIHIYISIDTYMYGKPKCHWPHPTTSGRVARSPLCSCGGLTDAAFTRCGKTHASYYIIVCYVSYSISYYIMLGNVVFKYMIA